MHVPVFGEERYTIQKKGYGWVQLGWMTCNRASGWKGVICVYKLWGATQKQHVCGPK